MANDKKKGLGKGLGALLGGGGALRPPTAPEPATPEVPAAPAAPVTLTDGTRLIEIDPSELKPNPKQPRLVFDEGALEELAESIKRDGVQEPVIVRPAADGGYELVSGERRVRASIMADRMLIPAVVRDISDADMLRLGLIENIQRENLNPIETAKAYHELMREMSWTQDRLAQELGKKRATVANTLRLLQLPDSVQEHLAAGTLTMGHAKALAVLKTEEEQERMAGKILAKGLSVRESEDLVNHAAAPRSLNKQAPPRPKKDVNVAQIEDDLRRKLGRKVAIRNSEDGRGFVELSFFSWADLDVLIDQIKSG